MNDMGKLIEEMKREHALSTPPDFDRQQKVCACACARGKLTVVDGPFAETKEVIGGYAMLEAESKEEAIELTKRFLRIHGDEWDIECEVRQLDGPEIGGKA